MAELKIKHPVELPLPYAACMMRESVILICMMCDCVATPSSCCKATTGLTAPVSV